MVTRGLQGRFGEIVAERRGELGLSRKEVGAAGGPSVATLARVEHPGDGTAPPSPKTLKLLDIGLRWAPGSARLALHGGDPAAVAEPSPTSSSGEIESDPLAFRLVEVDIDVVDSLVGAADLFFQLCDRTDLPEAAQQAAQMVKEQLGIAVGRLAAAQATEVLERAGGPGRELPKGIERLLGALLAAPPVTTGGDCEDQQYRRWLAAKAIDLDPAGVDRFTRRWRSKLERIRLTEGEGR
ncbi:multiprotein-bridging factor 1 family protein [Nocardia sp. NPDC058705]|uniref:helix-turn-helix domain-containing protein n=1 Tax=Nocardia sp. NPDC058705 TaxID=3346609 RepID=UPI0036B6CE62